MFYWRLLSCLLASSSVYATCLNPVISTLQTPPDVVIDEQGLLSGDVINYATQLITPIFGEPQITEALPPSQLYFQMKHGKIDINVRTAKSDYRSEIGQYTESISTVDWGVVTLKRHYLEWKGLNTLDSKRGAYVVTAPLPEPYASYVLNNPNVETVPNSSSLIAMLNSERIDYMVTGIGYLPHFITEESNLLIDEFTVYEESIVEMPVFMLVSNRSPCAKAIDKLNAAILEVGHFEKITW